MLPKHIAVRKSNDKANVDMILTAIVAGVMFAVAIPIVYSVVGGVDYATTDLNLRTGLIGLLNTTDYKTTGINPNTTTVLNLTNTPTNGASSIYNVSQFNSSVAHWYPFAAANWTYDATGNNITIDSGQTWRTQDRNTSIIQAKYYYETDFAPAGNSSNTLITNLGTFFTIGPIYLVVVAAVGIIAAVLLLRRR